MKLKKTYLVFTDPLRFDSVDTFLLLETVIALALHLICNVDQLSKRVHCSIFHIYYLRISIEYIN